MCISVVHIILYAGEFQYLASLIAYHQMFIGS